MFRPWHCTLTVSQAAATILVQDGNRDLLKARLPAQPNHPRALLTLFEGLSLWRGQPLSVALSVAEHCHPGPGSMLFGDGLWPAESVLVQFENMHPEPVTRLAGVGDFRQIRQLARRASR